MSSDKIIGVDMGGTKIHSGRIASGILEIDTKIATPSSESEHVVLQALIKAIENVMDSSVKGIGIGVPSVVDVKQGIVYDVTAIPSWREVHLKKELEKHFNLPVFVNNDANCFALGEKTFGKGQKFSNLVGLTLGTGLGMGLILNGQLYSGTNCGAGELGSLRYKNSILENYCASHFFISQYQTTGLEIFQRAEKGDPQALEILSELGRHLGYALELVILAYDPEMVVFGGSVSQAFPYFIGSLRQYLSGFPYQNSIRNLILETSEIKNIALLGAAALAINQ